MPDTARTRDELISLLADNSTGDIGAQDIRDFLASISLTAEERHRHDQTTPATTWTINHNLGRNPILELWNYTGGNRIGPSSSVDQNTTVITFDAPATGTVVAR